MRKIWLNVSRVPPDTNMMFTYSLEGIIDMFIQMLNFLFNQKFQAYV